MRARGHVGDRDDPADHAAAGALGRLRQDLVRRVPRAGRRDGADIKQLKPQILFFCDSIKSHI